MSEFNGPVDAQTWGSVFLYTGTRIDNQWSHAIQKVEAEMVNFGQCLHSLKGLLDIYKTIHWLPKKMDLICIPHCESLQIFELNSKPGDLVKI